MQVCLAGKNNIAVESAEYILNEKIIDKQNLFVIPNQDDPGVDTYQRSFKKFALHHGLPLVSLEDIYERKY